MKLTRSLLPGLRRALPLLAAAVVGMAGMTGTAGAPAAHAAAPDAAPQAAPAARDVQAAKDRLARSLAASLADPAWAAEVRRALVGGEQDPIRLAEASATAAARRFAADARRANSEILRAKGLPATAGSVLELRLGHPSMLDELRGGAELVVAAETGDDVAAAIPAYRTSGGELRLDPVTVPDVPVAVLGVNETRTLELGLATLRAELARAGVQTSGVQTSAGVTAAGGYWTTRVMSVYLNDDEEPWIKGDAEIYSIVSGVGVDDKPHVDIVQMPYLDEDGRTYYPGQILVNWSNFKYNAVDVVMMEEDDGTDYQALAQALATALLTVLDGVQYAPMVNAILDAMPDSWWTDDPDYVDSWYLITRETSDTRTGARGNGTIDFEPYYVTAL